MYSLFGIGLDMSKDGDEQFIIHTSWHTLVIWQSLSREK